MEKSEESATSDLSTFDGRLMDGFEFCRRVYAFFHEVRTSPDGLERIRLRKSRIDKKLMEELIPITEYVRQRYTPTRRIRVRWRGGSQRYDAILLSSGVEVESGHARRRQCLEITTAVHPHDHLKRRRLHEEGFVFGVRGIRFNKQTRKSVSDPHIYVGNQNAIELAESIVTTVKQKASKPYAAGTVLLVRCVPPVSLLLEHEWRDAIKCVEAAELRFKFSEIFLLADTPSGFSAFIAGKRYRRRRDA